MVFHKKNVSLNESKRSFEESDDDKLKKIQEDITERGKALMKDMVPEGCYMGTDYLIYRESDDSLVPEELVESMLSNDKLVAKETFKVPGTDTVIKEGTKISIVKSK